MSNYVLTRRDFEDAVRIIQRVIEFRNAEDLALYGGGRTTRSDHLQETVKTLALTCDFWAVPNHQPRNADRPTANTQRSQYRRGKGNR